MSQEISRLCELIPPRQTDAQRQNVKITHLETKNKEMRQHIDTLLGQLQELQWGIQQQNNQMAYLEAHSNRMNQTFKTHWEYLLQCHHELQQRDEAIARLEASRMSMHQEIEMAVWENLFLRKRLGDLEWENSQHRKRAHASTQSPVHFGWRHRSASC